MLKYSSTRGQNEIKRSTEAIIQGIAKDKGLFVPMELPKLQISINELKEMSYQEIAFQVMKEFLVDFSEAELKDAINKAYDEKFEKDEIVPIEKVDDVNIVELYHGKTAAFKDMALSILPHLLVKSIKQEKEDKKIVILTATSGDTGKAALDGFAGVENIDIIVFYPETGVSQIQKQQMVTQEEENTHVVAIKGNFDDAQTSVKTIFNDRKFSEELAEHGYMFSSANSINIGRLVPQVAYYVYSYAKLVQNNEIKDGEKINIVVPTGNFGNILAAYYASQMGIPVNKFICASNKNKVLTDFINTGIYDINREFHVTNSPSMDILISSNLERLLYHISGNNSEIITDLMDKLETDKKYELPLFMKENLKDFVGGFTTEEETLETIKEVYKKDGYLMDTHTAVAYKVYEDYKKETNDQTKTIIASTASPYKFTTSVIEAIEVPAEGNEFELLKQLNEATKVSIPKGLKDLDKKEIKHTTVIEKTDIKNEIKNILF